MADKLMEYHAIVWAKDETKPGARITIVASNGEEAVRILKEKFGDDIVFTMRDEESDNRVR